MRVIVEALGNILLYLSKFRFYDPISACSPHKCAFDTVDEDIILIDLLSLGNDGVVLEWFRTYLKNRKFRVCVNDTLSDECLMKAGVPQGRIRGSILFPIYTVELHYVLECLVVSVTFTQIIPKFISLFNALLKLKINLV